MRAVLHGLTAALVAAALATFGFLLIGVLLPVWAMILVYGRQNVQDAPAHGGIILFVTVPITGVLAACGFFLLVPLVYHRLSSRSGN